MPDGRFRGVVWSLGLGNVDDLSGHAADHDDAARCLTLHEVFCDTRCEKVCAVNINPPELLHSVIGVGDGIEVLGEPGGGDQVVDSAMLLDDLRKSLVYGVGVRYIGIVCGDSGQPIHDDNVSASKAPVNNDRLRLTLPIQGSPP